MIKKIYKEDENDRKYVSDSETKDCVFDIPETTAEADQGSNLEYWDMIKEEPPTTRVREPEDKGDRDYGTKDFSIKKMLDEAEKRRGEEAKRKKEEEEKNRKP